MPKRSSFAVAQFDTLRLRLIKIAARVVEMKTQIRLHLRHPARTSASCASSSVASRNSRHKQWGAGSRNKPADLNPQTLGVHHNGLPPAPDELRKSTAKTTRSPLYAAESSSLCVRRLDKVGIGAKPGLQGIVADEKSHGVGTAGSCLIDIHDRQPPDEPGRAAHARGSRRARLYTAAYRAGRDRSGRGPLVICWSTILQSGGDGDGLINQEGQP